MDLGRLLIGLLTGGLSEIPINIVNAQTKKQKAAGEYGSVDDLMKMITDAVQTNAVSNGDGSPTFSSKYSENPEWSSYQEGNGLSDWIAGNTGSRLTTAEEQANAFNRSERIASQNFSHNEAVDARMWEQYVAQNKYQWETQSMQAAGINPALAYGGGNLVATNATGAMGSSSPASSVSPHHGSIGDLLNGLFTLARMPMELKNMQAQLKSQRLDNDLKQKELDWYDKKAGADVENTAADTAAKIKSLDEIDSRIKNNEMDTELKRAGVDESQARTAVEWAKYAQIGLNNELQEQLNPLLVQAQEYENELKHVESQYRERQIIAELAETRAKTAALYAQAALDGARKEGVDIANKVAGIEARFASSNAQSRANLLRWTAFTSREEMKQAKYQTQNAEYYAEHYEEAFRNSWSQSGTEFGYGRMIGEALGNAALLGLMFAY